MQTRYDAAFCRYTLGAVGLSVRVDSTCLILLCAIVADALAGDPARVYRVIPHPVVMIGNAIAAFEQRLNQASFTNLSRFLLGLGVSLGLVGATAIIAFLLSDALATMSVGWALEALLASTLLAGRGLYDYVRAVADALVLSLEGGRERIAHIVGRDPATLDTAGVARAAIESAAENFVDGFVAPAFWFAMLGLPGIVAYKTINTLDSMIGHRNERYEYFGKFAARLDDVANWIPARLGALSLAAGAALMRDASARRAWSTASASARQHRSLNAGWPEAAMAGALDIALAGPRQYADYAVDDAWMGRGRCSLNAGDINRALQVYWRAAGCASVMLLMLCAQLH